MVIQKKTVKNCLDIFERYSLLTSRKICQLEHLKRCIKNNDWDYHLNTRDSRYNLQKQIIEYNRLNFLIPPYFAPWLSGFVEAEGCFRSTHSLFFYIGQNDDWYILNAIKAFFYSHHKLGINKNLRTKNLQYRVSMSGKPTLKRVLDHFDRHPLLGHKKVSYEVFRQKFFQCSSNNKCHG